MFCSRQELFSLDRDQSVLHSRVTLKRHFLVLNHDKLIGTERKTFLLPPFHLDISQYQSSTFRELTHRSVSSIKLPYKILVIKLHDSIVNRWLLWKKSVLSPTVEVLYGNVYRYHGIRCVSNVMFEETTSYNFYVDVRRNSVTKKIRVSLWVNNKTVDVNIDKLVNTVTERNLQWKWSNRNVDKSQRCFFVSLKVDFW